MECEAADNACQIYLVLKDNEYLAAVLAKLVGQLGSAKASSASTLLNLLKDHGDKLIAAAMFSFGLYKWWAHRERILHFRLTQYLSDNDWRLSQSRNDLLEAIQRPGPGQPAALPLFASDELRSVLRERNWDRMSVSAAVEDSAQKQIVDAMNKLERQLHAGEQMIESLRHQVATAHVLRGAICSTTAERTKSSAAALGALDAFRAAQAVPGRQQWLLAKELEAHQLRKLGLLDDAEEAYEQLEKLATNAGDYRSQRLLIARAKRYQAEIWQAKTSTILTNGDRKFEHCNGAHSLLNAALEIRGNFEPYQDWELLEHADILYLSAFVAHNAGFVVLEPQRLRAARSAYKRVLDSHPRRIWNSRASKRMSLLAEAGLARVDAASENNPQYNWHWLLPL